MADFIKEHIVSKTKELVKDKRKILGTKTLWFWFDKKIKPNTNKSRMWVKTLNRINEHNVYQENSLLPVSWINIEGKVLLDVFFAIKENRFYTYKIIDNKSHKIRIKAR